MALKTRSSFYFGPTIEATEVYLDFAEGAGAERFAMLNPRVFSPATLAQEVEDALNAAGVLDYTVTLDRSTRKITISATGVFKLKIASGTHAGTTLWDKLGFTGAVDLTGLTTYQSDSAIGYEYEPQLFLLDYSPPSRNQDAIEATSNITGTGRVEVVTFGVEKFYEFTIDFITSQKLGDESLIESNPTGLEDAEFFMQQIVKRGFVEIMPDRDLKDIYDVLTLEKTPISSTGVGFKLNEKIGEGFTEFYSTGLLKFRLQE